MSVGSNKSSQNSSSVQSVWDQQAPFLQTLFQNAQQVFGQNQGATGQLQNQLGGINQGLQGALGQASMLGQGQGAGQQYLAGTLGQNAQNPYLEDVIRTSAADIQRGLQENILPSLTSTGVSLGGAGSSRHQIAAGLAGQQAISDIGDLSSDLRFSDYRANQAQQAANAQALTASQLGGQALQPGLFNLQSQNVAAQAGSPYANLQGFSNILGNPVTLGQSQSKGSSKGGSFGI